jgi:transposase
MAASNSAVQRRYPAEMRERAVRMVREAIAESGERIGAVTRVARQLGIGPESLRNWVKQADIDRRAQISTAAPLASSDRGSRTLTRPSPLGSSVSLT